MGERNRCMGASAKNQLISNVKNTIWGWKKLIGRKFSEHVVKNDIPHLTYEVVESKDGAIGIQVCYSMCTYEQFLCKAVSSHQLPKTTQHIYSRPVYIVCSLFDGSGNAG